MALQRLKKVTQISIDIESGNVTVYADECIIDGNEVVIIDKHANCYMPDNTRKASLMDELADSPNIQSMINELWSEEYILSKKALRGEENGK